MSAKVATASIQTDPLGASVPQDMCWMGQERSALMITNALATLGFAVTAPVLISLEDSNAPATTVMLQAPCR